MHSGVSPNACRIFLVFEHHIIVIKPVLVMEKEFLTINDLEESYMEYKSGNCKISSTAANLI